MKKELEELNEKVDFTLKISKFHLIAFEAYTEGVNWQNKHVHTDYESGTVNILDEPNPNQPTWSMEDVLTWMISTRVDWLDDDYYNPFTLKEVREVALKKLEELMKNYK